MDIKKRRALLIICILFVAGISLYVFFTKDFSKNSTELPINSSLGIIEAFIEKGYLRVIVGKNSSEENLIGINHRFPFNIVNSSEQKELGSLKGNNLSCLRFIH